VVLLLYCNRVPRAANAGTRVATTGLEWRVRRPDGGPRSAIAWSPRSLRERVRPDVRLETPPRMSVRRATASGHRAVLKHEAIWVGEERRPTGEGDHKREGSRHHDVPLHRAGRCRHGCVGENGLNIVPTMEANGNKPISPLSVTAEPHCVSVKNCSWGGGRFKVPPEDSSCSRQSGRGRAPGSIGCQRRAFGYQPSRRLREA
jgi:hypothetical protein